MSQKTNMPLPSESGAANLPVTPSVPLLVPTERKGADQSAREALNQQVRLYRRGYAAWYREAYLNSDHWRDLKAAKYAIQGHKCERCPCREWLQMHHNNYRDIFDVTIQDLEVLCDSCHLKEHGKWKPDPRFPVIMVVTPPNPAGSGKRSLRRLIKISAKEESEEPNTKKFIKRRSRELDIFAIQ